jgi:predicted DNA-binding transcriptional regulator AlpA
MSVELVLPFSDELIEAVARRAAELATCHARFLSKSALAAHLGVSTRTIKTWRERGLPGRKIGREVMFDLSEVERWIDSEGG